MGNNLIALVFVLGIVVIGLDYATSPSGPSANANTVNSSNVAILAR